MAHPLPAIVLGLGKNCSVHGWYGGIPRWSKVSQPCEEAVDVAARRAHDTSPGRQRSDDDVNQTMSVKQRQYVYGSISLCHRQHLDRAAGRPADVGMRQPDD